VTTSFGRSCGSAASLDRNTVRSAGVVSFASLTSMPWFDAGSVTQPATFEVTSKSRQAGSLVTFPMVSTTVAL